ncbi:MAG: transketolase C-terminal domain-containing protein [Vulcanimicrobiota bacterium]
MSSERILPMNLAIAEATTQSMESDPGIFVMGVGVDDPGGIFGTTRGPHDRFGDQRVFDTPLSENALTGVAVGAAVSGMRPIMVHARCDFLLLTLDQIINHAAKWRYMSGGTLTVPLVIRAVVGRGWGQAAQHSQSLQGTLAHFPGLQVILPSNAYDAKGLLMSALKADLPVVMIEHRWLHNDRCHVPEEAYTVPIGRARVAREGKDVTVVAVSWMVKAALEAAATLSEQGIEAEVLDLRSVQPWDREAVLRSTEKTGRLVVADTAWTAFGISAEISAVVHEELFGRLKDPVRRLGLPFTHTPCAPNLERAYYPGAHELCDLVVGLCRSQGRQQVKRELVDSKPFTGHF